ncbi:SulP family inorganic anion transporter [Kordiimonas gwangyangensis]|uniref:SulP family inorganic anion transporter n=1 Tax=Kordiimonas gwangyangensis TaxID=288022 RepID=UPI0003821E54|nr:sulfate permease [Kordiimonas gwangyangensis]
MGLAAQLSRFLPCLEWGRGYTRETLVSDVTAAVIVTIMLIPQSLAYAMLAGLPPEVGLYASMMPLVLYAVFGTSRTLAVGPVAVASLMSAAAVGAVVKQGTTGYVEASILLALLSAAWLLLMGFFRLGFLANFLSHPVISGFISASGILIAVSQLKHVLGVKASGHTLPEVVSSLGANLQDANGYTLLIGASCLAFLWFVRLRLGKLLASLGVPKGMAGFIVKAGPVLTVIVTILVTSLWQLDREGVAIVGAVPAGLPAFTFNLPGLELVKTLLLPAFLISVIGFVESVSVAQTLAAKRRQRIDPNQELIALGAANLGSGLSGGYVVTGGFARSVVNFDAGAQTPAAGVFTAVGMAVATLFLTPLIHYLPKATLAATIIVAVLALVDFRMMREIWVYSKQDFLAMAATVALTLGVSVEVGVASGVILSVLLHLYKSSRPHCAVVGLVPGTEHFRNILRHEVETCETIVTLRIDESLYFANARFLEDKVYSLLAANAKLKHVVLMCPAVNEIDASALESLEAINHRLASAGVKFHLSEVKGPVMDRLKRSHFLEALSGQVFLSQYQAYRTLAS